MLCYKHTYNINDGCDIGNTSIEEALKWKSRCHLRIQPVCQNGGLLGGSPAQ